MVIRLARVWKRGHIEANAPYSHPYFSDTSKLLCVSSGSEFASLGTTDVFFGDCFILVATGNCLHWVGMSMACFHCISGSLTCVHGPGCLSSWGRCLYMWHNDITIVYKFLKGQIMTCIDVWWSIVISWHFRDITQHILPSNSAEECLLNYSTFTLHFPACTQFIPQGSQSAQTLHYIIMVFCNLHCIEN